MLEDGYSDINKVIGERIERENMTAYNDPQPARYLVVPAVAARSEELRQYLPANYTLRGLSFASTEAPTEFLISGHDVGGWTAEYIIDRLASGLIFANEVTPEQANRLLPNLEEV